MECKERLEDLALYAGGDLEDEQRYSLAAAAAILLVVLFAGPLSWSLKQGPEGAAGLAEAASVEVERVGYSEAVVTILPARDESMTVVWIVSEEVAAQEN